MTTLQQVLANTKARQLVAEPFKSALLAEMASCPAYAKLATQEATLKAEYCIIGGFRRKYIVAKGIPITAAKLYAKGPAKCKTCGQANCAKNGNNAALRSAISEQVLAFREAYNAKLDELGAKPDKTIAELQELRTMLRCPLTGKLLSSGANHVDHAVPFSKLVKAWSEQEGIDLCTAKLWYKKNATLLEAWAKYHEANAELQLVNARANLQKGAR